MKQLLVREVLVFIILFYVAELSAQYSEEINPNAPAELEALSFTLGKWEFQWYHYDPSTKQNVMDNKSYSTVFMINDGYTYCDDFYAPATGNSPEARGTTFRSYDPVKKQYTMFWMVAGSLKTNSMKGREEDSKLIFEADGESSDKYGTFKSTITFYNISKNSYEWKQDRLYDNSYFVEKATFYKATRID